LTGQCWLYRTECIVLSVITYVQCTGTSHMHGVIYTWLVWRHVHRLATCPLAT